MEGLPTFDAGDSLQFSSTRPVLEEMAVAVATVAADQEVYTNHSNRSSMAASCFTIPEDSKIWSTVFEGIISVIVGICGLMGNGATIAVLSRPGFKETFHKLLVSLSVFDSLFIACAILIYAIRAHALHLEGNEVVHYVFQLLHPFAGFSMHGSIYITMAVSIERLLGVCYPMQSRTRPRRHLLAYLAPVLIFAVLINIPKAFESNTVELKDDLNITQKLQVLEKWQNDRLYIFYYKVWSKLILTTIIPISVLIFCNVGIFITLRKSRKSMMNNTNNSRSSNYNQNQKNENGLAIILIGIVLVFVLCHSCRFFLAFYEVSVAQDTWKCIYQGAQKPKPKWLYAISAINHLMLMVNSSVNFLIYCAVGTRFRNALTCRLGSQNSSSRRRNRAHYLDGDPNLLLSYHQGMTTVGPTCVGGPEPSRLASQRNGIHARDTALGKSLLSPDISEPFKTDAFHKNGKNSLRQRNADVTTTAAAPPSDVAEAVCENMGETPPPPILENQFFDCDSDSMSSFSARKSNHKRRLFRFPKNKSNLFSSNHSSLENNLHFKDASSDKKTRRYSIQMAAKNNKKHQDTWV